MNGLGGEWAGGMNGLWYKQPTEPRGDEVIKSHEVWPNFAHPSAVFLLEPLPCKNHIYSIGL